MGESVKRSKFIEIVVEEFEEYCNNQQYKGFSHTGMIEVILNIMEENGMEYINQYYEHGFESE